MNTATLIKPSKITKALVNMYDQPFKVRTVWLDLPAETRDQQINSLVAALQNDGHKILDIKFAACNHELYAMIIYA